MIKVPSVGDIVSVEMTTHTEKIHFNGKLIKFEGGDYWILNNWYNGDTPIGVFPKDHNYLYCWRVVADEYQHKIKKIDWTEDDINMEFLALSKREGGAVRARTWVNKDYNVWDDEFPF